MIHENENEFLSCELSYRLGKIGFDDDTKYVYFRNIKSDKFRDGVLTKLNDNKLFDYVDECDDDEYTQIILAPGLNQIRKWFREEKNIDINIIAEIHEDNFYDPPKYFVMYNGEFLSENFYEKLPFMCGKYEGMLKSCIENIIYKLEDLERWDGIE